MATTLPPMPRVPKAQGYAQEYAQLPNGMLRTMIYRAAAEIQLALTGEIALSAE